MLYIFQIVGGVICGVGLWAWYEKDMFSKVGRLTLISFDPALVFIIGGALVFVMGYTGCIGALRENTVLLLIVSYLFRDIMYI